MSRNSFGTTRRLKSGNWQVRYLHPHAPYRADGTPNQISGGTYRTKTEAENRRLELWRQVRDGEWKSPAQLEAERIAAERTAAMEGRTFGPYATEWMASRRLTPATLKSYQSYLDTHLTPQWADTPIRNITTPAVRAWLAVLAPSRPGARKKAFELFRAILNSAMDDGIISVNPCKRNMLNSVKAATSTKVTEHRERVPRALTMDQLKTAADNVPAYMRTLVLLSGMVGLRAGEARGLRGKDLIDHGTDGLFIAVRQAYTGQGSSLVKGTPKTGKSVRDVPVPPALADDLRAAAEKAGPDGLLFPGIAGRDQVLPIGTYQNALRRLEHTTDIGYVTPHDLRHTAASLMQAKGISQQVVADILGHTKTVMTQNYTHTFREQFKAAGEALSTLFEGLPAEVASLDQRRASNG